MQAFRFEKLVDLVNKEWVVDRDCQVDVTHMTRAVVAIKTASNATISYSDVKLPINAYSERGSNGETPNALS